MPLRTPDPGQLQVVGPAGITWQEFTWGELLDGLKKDLYLDVNNLDTTGLVAAGSGRLPVVLCTVSPFPASPNTFVIENFSTGTINLPAAPALGDIVVVDAFHSAGVITTVQGNGHIIWWNGASAASLALAYTQTVRFTFSGTDWRTEHD